MAERKTVHFYKEQGFEVARCSGSSVCDLVVWNHNSVLLIEVKATARKPVPSIYRPFLDAPRPGQGGEKILVWWPLGARKPQTLVVP